MLNIVKVVLVLSLLIPSVAMSKGEAEPKRESKDRLLSVTASLGKGIGDIPKGSPFLGGLLVQHGGLALSPIHLYLESHLKLSEVIKLGVFYRLQTEKLNHLGGLQAQVKLIPNQYHQLEGRLGVGYGYINHSVPVNDVDMSESIRRISGNGFTQSGSLSLKLGLVYSYSLTESWSLTTAVDAYHFLEAMKCEECTSLLHLDLSVGVRKSF